MDPQAVETPRWGVSRKGFPVRRSVKIALAIFVAAVFITALLPQFGRHRRLRYDERVEQARSALAEGNIDIALINYQFAISQGVDDVTVHREYQNLVLMTGDHASLLEEYRRRLSEKPSDPSRIYLHARLLDGKAMEDRMREAIQIDPAFPWPHIALGERSLEAGRYEEARAHFAEALRLDAELPEAREGSARALYFLGRYAESEADWTRLRNDHPDRAAAADLGLGLLYKSAGRPSEAAVLLSGLLGRDPLNVAALEGLLQALHALNRGAEAQKAFDTFRLRAALPPKLVLPDLLTASVRETAGGSLVTKFAFDPILRARFEWRPKGAPDAAPRVWALLNLGEDPHREGLREVSGTGGDSFLREWDGIAPLDDVWLEIGKRLTH